MASLSDLISRRDKLETVRAKGVKSVSFGDDQVEYRSDTELAAAINDLNRQIAALETKPVRQVRVICDKGA